MAAGDVRQAWGASAALTQTALDGLADSSTHVAGWQSDAIDNSTTKYLDFSVDAEFKVESAGVTAGEIRVWLVKEKNDSAWPDTVTGSEGTITFTDTEIRDAIARLAAVTVVDTTTGRTYYLSVPSVKEVFGGNTPRKFAVVVTQSTGTTLETTGDPNKVDVKGSYLTVEP